MEISSVSAPTMSYEDIMKPLKVLKEHEVTISSLERLLGEMVPHCLQVAKERGDGSFPEIEQLWRRLLFESLQLLPESDRIAKDSLPVTIISSSFKMLTDYPHFITNAGRVPFFLIEDMFKWITVRQAESFWEIFEFFMNELMTPELFEKGKLFILRTCNLLLKRVSRTYDASFCGRILLLLSSQFPLSEKSAINVTGSINNNNITTFESAAEFSASSLKENQTLSLEPKASSDTSNEDGEVHDYDISWHVDLDNIDDVTKKYVNYDYYKTLWELQSYFAAELKTLDSIEKWKSFVASISLVFDGFLETEMIGFPKLKSDSSTNKKEALKTMKDRDTLHTKAVLKSLKDYIIDFSHMMTVLKKDFNSSASQSNQPEMSSSNSESGSGSKFLTSSKFLGLQLKDPLIKQQIAAQVLFYLQSLRIKGFPFLQAANNSNVPPKPPPLRAKPVSAATPSPPSGLTQRVDRLKEIEDLEKKAFDIIELTENGMEISRVLKRIMAREYRQIQWKMQQCLPWELKRSLDQSTIPSEFQASWSEQHNKRPRTFDHHSPVAKQNSKEIYSEQFCAHEYYFDCSNMESVIEKANLIVENVPDFDRHASYYVDAEDPDNMFGGEEFHPKNDSLYCWLGRRLLSSKSIDVMEHLPDGNFARGLFKMGLIAENEDMQLKDVTMEEVVDSSKMEVDTAEDNGDQCDEDQDDDHDNDNPEKDAMSADDNNDNDDDNDNDSDKDHGKDNGSNETLDGKKDDAKDDNASDNPTEDMKSVKDPQILDTLNVEESICNTNSTLEDGEETSGEKSEAMIVDEDSSAQLSESIVVTTSDVDVNSQDVVLKSEEIIRSENEDSKNE